MTAQSSTSINLQPHPRLLTVLGDIEFAPWQCLAELIDNAFDEFLRNPPEETPTVSVTLPNKGSEPGTAEVWVRDNGPGLTLEQLQDALRAGWTSNDRVGSLGLFGMGFNIATARLGYVAMVRTARKDSPTWTVVTINLRRMAAQGTFDVPVRSELKDQADDHGTEVIIKELRPQHHATLVRRQAQIRQDLGNVYSYLLEEKGFRLIVEGHAVKPLRPCLWGEDRYVVRNRERIPAIIHIDEPLADRYVCLECGRWQDHAEELCEACGEKRVVSRPRRIWGWLGIQRYLDRNDYGVDFIRNGRKILLRDVDIFSWHDPDDPSHRGEVEYPMELPNGFGRIVGQIHVDHVPVNYQKSAFETQSPEWARVIRAIRGEGPVLPKKAKALNFPENTSPLARLVAGFRRNDPGLNYLIPGDGNHALHEKARAWAGNFQRGDVEYQADTKWYEQAELHDRPQEIDEEDDPTLDAEAFLRSQGLGDLPSGMSPVDLGTAVAAPPIPAASVTLAATTGTAKAESEDDKRARWRTAGRRLPDLEGKYGLAGQGAPLDVTVWSVNRHQGQIGRDGVFQPVYVGGARGSAAEIFIDAEHPVFTDFAVDTRDLVVMEIADYLRTRDRSTRALGSMFYDLKERCLPDHKISGPFLRQTADRIISRLREAMQPIIAGNSTGYFSLLPADEVTAAERTFADEGGRGDWTAIKSSGAWLDYTPAVSLVRLVTNRPDAFMDGLVFKTNYSGFHDDGARQASVERVTVLLADVAALADRSIRRGPEELQRGRLSCWLLEEEIATEVAAGHQEGSAS